MLIDWLTLRYPLSDQLGSIVHQRIVDATGMMVRFAPNGDVLWEKAHLDFEALRSDSVGLYWSVTADGNGTRYLTIGASPASLNNQGVNVFGSSIILDCAQTLVDFAGVALGSILPAARFWQCRRVDITANYDLGSAAQVKQALRLLLSTDAPRRRTNSDRKGGDSVYWNPSSDLQAAKAYHKGAHLRMLSRKSMIEIDDDLLELSDRLLRLELKLGARWFRRREDSGLDWKTLTPQGLADIHNRFFSQILGSDDIEVSDMENLLQRLEKVTTAGRARSAHNTWLLIRSYGYTHAKESVNPSSWRNHLSILRQAGLSNADLCAGQVIPFRRKALVLSEPVTSWNDLIKRAA